LKKASHLCFRRTIIRNGEPDSYNIDVVTEQGLSQFMRQVETEMEKAANQIKRKKAVFERSIAAIYQQTKRLKSKECISSRLHL
jgi:hypothetical protein